MSEKLAAAETWFRRVWSEESEAAIEELFVPDGHAKGLGTYQKAAEDKFADHLRIGPQEFTEFHRAMLSLVGDVRVEVTTAIEDGDWIALLCVLKAKRRGTNESVQMTGTIFAKIIDGKIVDAYNHFDFMSLFAQLGHLPDQTFETCLSGQKVGV
ncbi:MAG: ester cyclase [Pseudomonadota bacterium]